MNPYKIALFKMSYVNFTIKFLLHLLKNGNIIQFYFSKMRRLILNNFHGAKSSSKIDMSFLDTAFLPSAFITLNRYVHVPLGYCILYIL